MRPRIIWTAMMVNIPNILTVARIILAVILVFLLKEASFKSDVMAIIVFAVASLTDFYDGYFARTRGLVSDFGKIMDPIADKVLILCVLGVFARMGIIALWMFAVIAIREIVVTISRIMAMQKGKVLAAERAGKIKTVCQISAISFILLYLTFQQSGLFISCFHAIQPLWALINQVWMILAVILTVYSGIEYFYLLSFS
ncbi:MAG: CDP-diacylglycerol--glycerol-3-phosphate 3-phosphatidyltransferase [Candidatus Omnitrophica bacterium]|nr:CDP-diacylglycerol--glycerol-3-phosphate 3-phosphatidyltransferase [Candidatus Omnitrophota bacterium]